MLTYSVVSLSHVRADVESKHYRREADNVKRNRLFLSLLVGALLVLCLAAVSAAADDVTVFKF